MLEISYKCLTTYRTIDARTPFVEIDPLRGADSITLRVDAAGLVIRSSGGNPVSVTWEQLVQLHEHGLPDPHRWGVVIDGTLAEVHPTESAARDRMTEHRAHGCRVRIIKVPAEKI